MDATVKAVVHACTKDSDAGRVSFGEVVGKLIEAGVERYHTDLVRSEKTYYMPDGTSEVVPADAVAGIAPASFSAAGVEAAVRAIQAGMIAYQEFCERIVAAGCTGYFVSLAGRRAVYYSRTIDCHVEWFPRSR
jgi:uncharacterized protein YbcV (DUF1398 family)